MKTMACQAHRCKTFHCTCRYILCNICIEFNNDLLNYIPVLYLGETMKLVRTLERFFIKMTYCDKLDGLTA